MVLPAYLQPELVEEVVDEVLDEVDDALVQVLARDAVEDDPGGGRGQFVAEPEVLLVAVDGHLERQDGQHQQVVLTHDTRSSAGIVKTEELRTQKRCVDPCFDFFGRNKIRSEGEEFGHGHYVRLGSWE